MIIEGGDEGAGFKLAGTSRALVWIMLLPTVGMVLFWDRIQALTGRSWKFFTG